MERDGREKTIELCAAIASCRSKRDVGERRTLSIDFAVASKFRHWPPFSFLDRTGANQQRLAQAPRTFGVETTQILHFTQPSLVDETTRSLEIRLKLYHAHGLGPDRQQFMAEAPVEGVPPIGGRQHIGAPSSTTPP